MRNTRNKRRLATRNGKPTHSVFPGVTYEHAESRRNKPWKAYVVRNGRQINLGRYPDESAAHTAVQEYRNGETHGNAQSI